jgi:hypothetical protein
MINNYDKTYQRFLDIVTEIHNAHIAYKIKPTNHTSLRVRKGITAMKNFVVPFRAAIMEAHNDYSMEQRRIWEKHKDKLREKREASAIRKQLKKEKE